MKVLFLDIDGVLATFQGMHYHERLHTNPGKLIKSFCPIATSNLLTVLEEIPSLKIVISSTWRFNMDRVEESFKLSGLPWDRVVGHTRFGNDEDEVRGHQIQAWLDEHEVEQYAIVDDDRDMLESQMPNFVRTNTMTGLNLFDAVKLILVFYPEYDRKSILNYERKES